MLVSKRPSFDPGQAEALALEHYAIRAQAKELPSERDQNFRLTTEGGKQFVLKLSHPDEPKDVLDFQAQALKLLAAPYYPNIYSDKTGKPLLAVPGKQGVNHLVRMLSYLPGTPIAECEHPSPALLNEVGRTISEMDRMLSSFTHPAMNRHLPWDSRHALETVRDNLSYILASEKRTFIEHFLTLFECHAVPLFPALRQSVIHNDVNDYNLLVDGDRVTGIIDFGDMVHTYTVCDLANACAYLMMDKPNPLEIICYVAEGYQSVYPLELPELNALLDFIYLRLCLSVSMSAKQRAQNPDNDYLSISERPAWDLLETLSQTPIAQLREHLSTALSN